MRKSCILTFKTKMGNQYVFDGNTATVLPVDDILLDCILAFENEDIDHIQHQLYFKHANHDQVDIAMKFVADFIYYKGAFYRDEGYVRSERKWLNTFDGSSIQAALEQAGFMEQIVLNVTENCNLRCKYCFLSETYDHTRNRTSKIMEETVAFQALDYFFSKMRIIAEYNPGKMCAITFYGGEPLLNFSLVKKCIEYTKKNCPVPFIFNLTTNGLLLKDEIAEYLAEQGVYIAVSLDGTKENHDRNRLDSHHSGSYDTIYQNLKVFMQKYPNYLRINILSVFDYKTNLMKNELFFQQEKLPRISFINQVLAENTEYYNQFTERDIKEFQSAYIQMLNQFYENKKTEKMPGGYADMLFETSLALILCRGRMEDKRLPILPFTNTCLPGTKISVRTDGTFDICEKIDYQYPIGNAMDGLDYEKITEIIKNYNKVVTDACHVCPISKICTACFARCAAEGGFKTANCEEQLGIFLFQLSLVYSLYEENPHAFDYFENKVEWTFHL